MIKILCLLCACVAVFGLSAKTLPDDMFTVEQRHFVKVALSEEVVQQSPGVIYKDSKGRLWLVYRDFVLQVIGEQVRRFAVPSFVNKPDVQSLYPNVIEFNNRIIISWLDRLISYDESNQRLVSFHADDFVIANRHDSVVDLDIDSKGRLWVLTIEEIFILSPTANTFIPLTIDKRFLPSNDYAFMSLEPDAFGDVWISSRGLGLLRVNADTLAIKQQQLNTDPDKSKADGYFFSFKQYDQHTALVGTDLGLFRFNLQQQTFTRLFPNLIQGFTGDIHVMPDNHVVLQDNQKLFMLKDDLTTAIAIKAGLHFDQPISDYITQTLFIDDESVHWLGVKGLGLFRYSPTLTKIDTVRLTANTNSDHNISQIQQISGDRYVVAGVNGGDIIGVDMVGLEKAIDIDQMVFTIAEDDKGMLWFGGSKQLIKYDSDGTMNVAKGNGDKRGEGDYLSSYYDQKDNLWLVDDQKGLSVYNTKTESQIPSDQYSIDAETRLKMLFVSGNSKTNTLWLASPNKLQIINQNDLTKSHDVLTFNSPQQTLSHVRQQGNELHLFHKNNQVTMVNLDSQKNRSLTLPVDNVGCLIEDGSDIWLAQRHGSLYRWQLATKSLVKFDGKDGVPYGGLNGKVCTKINDRLVFTGLNGVVSPKPQIIVNDTQPTLSISHITMGEQIQAQTLGLEVNAGQFPLSFHLVNSSLTSPQQNRLSYRLLGLSEQWTERANASGRLTFESLGSGSYTLQVKGSNNEGLFSEVAELPFDVLPPLWLTWWAKISYLLLLGAGFYWLHLSRTKHMLQRAQTLEKTVQNRTEELERQKKRVEQLLDFKEQEFVNVSHELRTPLTLVAGPIKQALSICTEKDVQHLLNMASRNSARLLRMVEQLLQLERFRLQKVLDKSMQPISDYVEIITDSFYVPVSDKNIVLKVAQNDPCKMLFVADAFEKILINLISNAIKYSPRGSKIVINSKVDGETLLLSVADTGIGIKPIDQPRIFNKFFRVMDESSEKVTGAGVGLALVKELVEAHGGHIEVNSVPSEGSEFIVELPVIGAVDGQDKHLEAGLEDKPKVSTELIDLEIENLTDVVVNDDTDDITTTVLDDNRTTILIIEDNPDMQAYIAGILSKNYQCVIAGNGLIGVEKALEIVPDLILSDVMMPVMNGFESTKLIKEDERTSHIPVIMLTARGDKDSRLTGWKSLADEYLSKPFDEEELELRVSNLLSIRSILRHKFAGVIADKGVVEEVDVEVMLSEKDTGFITKLNEILADNFQDDSFSVNEMAEALFMSRRQLLRKLKGVIDTTPQEYLRRFRLQKAAEFLQQGLRVTEVAIASGFASQSHFSTCFKTQFDLSPKAYQSLHRDQS